MVRTMAEEFAQRDAIRESNRDRLQLVTLYSTLITASPSDGVTKSNHLLPMQETIVLAAATFVVCR